MRLGAEPPMDAHSDIDPSNLVPGTVIGSYEVLGKLGHGGYGDVYRVRRGARQYALKISSQRHADLTPEERQNTEERTRREIATLTSLKHPNVVHCHGFDKWPDLESGYLYFVTDLIEGERIYVWQVTHRPSLRNILGVFVSLARGLEEIHRRLVFHRDVKNENVLVRADGEPILVDFGISRPATAYTVTGLTTLTGTYSHFSPSLCRYILSKAALRGVAYECHPEDDLHPLGFMLYEMLTGARPFVYSELVDPFELFHDIAERIPPAPRTLNPAIPPVVEQLVQRLLAKTEAEAFASASAVVQALEEALTQADETWDVPFLVTRRSSASVSGPTPRFNSKGEPVAAVAVPPSFHPSEKSDQVSGLEALLFQDAASAAPVKAKGASGPPSVRQLAPASVPQEQSLVPHAPGGSAAKDFRLPTGLSRAFVAPDGTEAEAPSSTGPSPAADASQVRQRLAELRGGNERRGRKIGGLAIAAVGGAVLAAFLLTRGGAGGERPRNLLAKYDQNGHEELASASKEVSGDATPPMPAALVPVPHPVGAAVSAASDGSQPIGAPAAKGHSDAAQIDAELAQAYGRPTVGSESGSAPTSKPAPAVPLPAPSSRPSWVKGVAIAEAPSAPTGPKKLGIPFGAHVRVRLRSVLDSRTVGSGLVEARLVRPYALGHDTLIPVGAMVYGQAQTGGGRFLLHFTKLVLPDHTELALNADSVDANDGKSGLAPSRRDKTEAQTEGVGASVAKGTANVLLNTVGGSTAGNVVSNAGQNVLSRSDGTQGNAEEVLYLESGIDFEMVLREAI